jgi:hypothetical protein
MSCQGLVAHGLGVTPTSVNINVTSTNGGDIWCQATPYDATYIYLVAEEAGVTGIAQVWTTASGGSGPAGSIGPQGFQGNQGDLVDKTRSLPGRRI